MIEHRLHDYAEEFFPATPPLADAVLGRLPRMPDPVGHRVSRRTLAVAIAALVLTGTAIAASALDLVPGVRIHRAERLPELPYSLPPLGVERSLEEARKDLPFEPVLPAGLGEPYRIFVDRDLAGAPVLSAVYGGDAGARLVLTQWPASYILFDKLLRLETIAEYVDVHGAEGIWIEGGDHAVFYLGTSGGEGRVGGYVTGNVLVWHRGSVSYRLELGSSKQRALDIAASLRPAQ